MEAKPPPTDEQAGARASPSAPESPDEASSAQSDVGGFRRASELRPAGRRAPPALPRYDGWAALARALSELNRRDAEAIGELLASGAACPDLCLALQTQVESKRTLCAEARAGYCSRAQIWLADKAAAVLACGCECGKLPDDEIVEQPIAAPEVDPEPRGKARSAT